MTGSICRGSETSVSGTVGPNCVWSEVSLPYEEGGACKGGMRIKSTKFTVTAALVVFGIVWVTLAAEGGLVYLLIGWTPADLGAFLVLALLGCSSAAGMTDTCRIAAMVVAVESEYNRLMLRLVAGERNPS